MGATVLGHIIPDFKEGHHQGSYCCQEWNPSSTATSDRPTSRFMSPISRTSTATAPSYLRTIISPIIISSQLTFENLKSTPHNKSPVSLKLVGEMAVVASIPAKSGPQLLVGVCLICGIGSSASHLLLRSVWRSACDYNSSDSWTVLPAKFYSSTRKTGTC
jgi:hypothetical protein